jgi:hypothetical protein
MSEFSSTYHCKGIEVTELEAILSKLPFESIILDPNNISGFIPFISCNNLEMLKPVFPGILIDYKLAEDFGLWMDFYFNGTEFMKLEADWEQEKVNRKIDHPGGKELVRIGLFRDENQIENLIQRFQKYEHYDWKPGGYDFQEFMGLACFRWISHSDLFYRDPEDIPTVYPNAIFIEGIGGKRLEEVGIIGFTGFVPLPEASELPPEFVPIAEAHIKYWLEEYPKREKIGRFHPGPVAMSYVNLLWSSYNHHEAYQLPKLITRDRQIADPATREQVRRLVTNIIGEVNKKRPREVQKLMEDFGNQQD